MEFSGSDLNFYKPLFVTLAATSNPKVESSESNYYADNFLSVAFLANITLVDFNAFLVQFPLYFNQLPLIMFMRKPLYTA